MAQKLKDDRKKKVIDALNKGRSMELRAIYQYMIQHYDLADMDYGDLAAKVKLIAIDEMRHAEMFAERIKELDGEPTVNPSDKVVKNQKIDAIFPFDAQLEGNTIDVYNELREICRENNDSTSMKLFETIIDEEQVHFNYFTNVGDHIEELNGAFLAQIAGTPSDTGSTPRGFISSQGGA